LASPRRAGQLLAVEGASYAAVQEAATDELERWTDARNCFLKALEYDPNLAEAYVNLGIHKYLSVTFDLQYMKDNYVLSNNDVKGWIFGVRATSEF
jgi:lipoprotein NlpI